MEHHPAVTARHAAAAPGTRFERDGGCEPVRFATWGRWCGPGPVRSRLADAELDAGAHCARCDRRVVGIDCDGWAFTLQRGPHRNDYGRWVTGLWLGRDVISRQGQRVRF